MSKHVLAAAAAAGLLSFAVSGTAAAADVSYILNHSEAFPDGVNYGTVDLTQDGSDVDVLVTLASGFQFVKTGNHDSFTFNITGASGYGVTGISPSEFSWFQPASNPALGSYSDGLECLACGNGGSNAIAGPLSFTVTGVTLANFTNNAKGYAFSADIVGDRLTGAVAATSSPPNGVPEPATWAMMIAGFGGVGAMLRRQRREAALA